MDKEGHHNKNRPVANRDLKVLQIDEEIKRRRDLIRKKKKELEKKSAMNYYLKDVGEDYSKFYNYAIQQKQKEYKAMHMLKEYIADLTKTEKLLDTQLKTAKYDQKDIMNEIDKIKGEIDELIV
jgi:hypothetical protein